MLYNRATSRWDWSKSVSAVAVAAALALSGCGDSTDDTSSSGTNGPDTTATSESAAQPTGTPIKTSTISAVDYNGPTYEDIQVVAKIYAQYINDKGGINGRPLEVITCDDKGDPTQTEACARKAIDEGAIADVGTFTYNQSVMVPLYDKADTAVFGNCCNLAPIEFTSRNTFQMGNNPVLNPAGVARAVQDGCKDIAVLALDLPGITEGVTMLMDNMGKSYGYEGKIKYVKVPLTTQDYTAQVAQATDGTDCISMFLSQSNISGLMPAFAQTGGTQRLYGAQGNFDKVATKGYEKLPGVEKGVVYGAYPPLQDPVWDEFRAALKKYDAPKKFDYNSLAALGTWAAYTGFTQVAESVEGDLAPASFLKGASTAKVDTGGMTPPIDFTKTWDAFDGQFKRTFNLTATYFDLKDSKPLAEGFVDLQNAAEGKGK
jgi:branched-chain amino acid transport system substrate-binding protein